MTITSNKELDMEELDYVAITDDGRRISVKATDEEDAFDQVLKKLTTGKTIFVKFKGRINKYIEPTEEEYAKLIDPNSRHPLSPKPTKENTVVIRVLGLESRKEECYIDASLSNKFNKRLEDIGIKFSIYYPKTNKSVSTNFNQEELTLIANKFLNGDLYKAPRDEFEVSEVYVYTQDIISLGNKNKLSILFQQLLLDLKVGGLE